MSSEPAKSNPMAGPAAGERPVRERLALARGQDLSPDEFAQLAADAHAGVRRALAGRSDLSPAQLHALSRDPDPEVQAGRCLAIIVEALATAGARPEDVVRTRTYLLSADDWEAVGRAHGRVFSSVRPASTMVVVAALLDPRWRVEIEAEAIIGSASPPGDPEAPSGRLG